MDTLTELEEAFRRLEKDLPEIILKQTEVAALDIMALVDMRLVEDGRDENGAPFSDYTPSYKARKKKLGRYRNHVDFTLTGQMLASTNAGLKNIGAKSKNVSGVRATVIIGPLDEETRGKVAGNDKSRPGFLNPSKEEVERVERIRTKRIEDMISEEYFT